MRVLIAFIWLRDTRTRKQTRRGAKILEIKGFDQLHRRRLAFKKKKRNSEFWQNRSIEDPGGRELNLRTQVFLSPQRAELNN